jgi:hypothetical protein
VLADGIFGFSNACMFVERRKSPFRGLEHLKIETRLIDERFASVMGECVTLK